MIHRLVRELGANQVDLFATAARAEEVAERLVGLGWTPARAPLEAARQAVSEALVAAIRAGHPGARDQLLSVWLDEVYRWCRFNGGRGLVVEDVAHDALLRMFEQLPHLRDPSRFRPWLWSLVWRVLREQQRRSWLRRWVGSDAPEPMADAPALDQQVHLAEREVRVERVLAALDLDQRGLLYLAYVEGIGRAQIAEQLAMPLGTLNRRLTAARAAFVDAARSLGLDDLDEASDLDATGEER